MNKLIFRFVVWSSVLALLLWPNDVIRAGLCYWPIPHSFYLLLSFLYLLTDGRVLTSIVLIILAALFIYSIIQGRKRKYTAFCLLLALDICISLLTFAHMIAFGNVAYWFRIVPPAIVNAILLAIMVIFNRSKSRFYANSRRTETNNE